jgi:hypothetical protein
LRAEPFPLVHISGGILDSQPPVIDGRDVVWIGREAAGHAVYHFDTGTGVRTRLSNYTASAPGRAVVEGRRIVWEHNGIHLHDLDTTAATVTLSSNPRSLAPAISGATVVWLEARAADSRTRVMRANALEPAQAPVELDGFADHSGLVIRGNDVAWHGRVGAGPETEEVYHRRLDSTVTARLTNNAIPDVYPTLGDGRVVWQTFDTQPAAEIYFRDFATGQNARLTFNGEADRTPKASGARVVWQGGRDMGAVSDVYLHDFDLAQTRRLTSSAGYPESYGEPEIADGSVVWSGLFGVSSTTSEIYFHDVGAAMTWRVTENELREEDAVVAGYSVAFRREEPFGSNVWQVYLTRVPEPATGAFFSGIAVAAAVRKRRADRRRPTR